MGEIMGHKDKQTWLIPSHVLQDPLFHHSNKHQFHNSVNNHHHHHHRDRDFHRPGVPTIRQNFPTNYNTRQKHQNNWQRSKRDDRMQAFFLVSPGRKTSGTGVFLPATSSHPPTRKSVCSPVLLPARVVQALNLNVHNGIHISPRQEIRENDSKKKKEMVVTPKNNAEKTPIDEPEKLLPEEWIY